jgi:hypothetical protein
MALGTVALFQRQVWSPPDRGGAEQNMSCVWRASSGAAWTLCSRCGVRESVWGAETRVGGGMVPFLQVDTSFASAHALGCLHVLRSAR